MKKSSLVYASIILAYSWNVNAAEGDIFVAGVKPDQRPANAPAITKMDKPRSWYDRAVTGIVPPYPASFRFIDHQGNWYTPFNNPGMLTPYDIRGWHQIDQ